MKTYKIGLIIVSFVSSVVLAAFVGASLAMWDKNIGVREVVEYFSQKNEDVIVDTHTMVNSSSDIIIKYTTPDFDKSVISSSSRIEPMTAIPEPLQAKAIALNAEEEEVVVEEVIEEAEEKVEDIEEVEVTQEVSGVPELLKAGEESVMANDSMSLPNGSQESGEFRDPLATYPLEFTEVSESYFDDALFIGDSRVQGLGMYSGTNATFFAATAFQLFEYKTFKVVPTANGKIPIFDAMPFDAFTKVYIKVGLNELGCVSEEKFISVYQELLDQVRMMQPRAIVYIQAVFPVTAAKSSTDKTHNNPKIISRNESIKAFAAANNCYYIDASEPFVDETGALRAETTADGIHMYARFMPEWIEYLRKHAVPWP